MKINKCYKNIGKLTASEIANAEYKFCVISSTEDGSRYHSYFSYLAHAVSQLEKALDCNFIVKSQIVKL